MALTILSSNQVETLQSRLTEHISGRPLADPFASEVIVVPTFAMSRWLNLRIAQQQGIAANIAYPQLSEWIWSLATSLLPDRPDHDPYSSHALSWQIFSILPNLLQQKAFKPLRHYLGDDDSGIKRWQLAQRVAECFDRYQAYRPEMIRAWSMGKENHWQAVLWRSIKDSVNQPDRVATMTEMVELLGRDDSSPRLPQRASLFALSNLPPLHIELLRALAQKMELNLYLHSPTDQYWADLENEKRRARRRLEHPQQDELFDTGNELLASWGQQGQVFQDLLLNHAGVSTIDIDLFSPPDDSSLLGNIQRSIFSLEPATVRGDSDSSITLHICHSAMRECEVLHDQLLAMLQQDESLNPENILVMIPDIATYAPYIEAVFQSHRLAYNISDITLADEHPLVLTFLQLLKLPRSRFTTSEILAYLDNEALCDCFGFDDQAQQQIRRLVEHGHTRWGINANHKSEFDLPATSGNTWQQARDRFFAGYALASDELWRGIAPLDAWDESDADALGRFWHFFDSLSEWRTRLSRTRSLREWQGILLQLLDDFFVEAGPQDPRLQQIRSTISELYTAVECQVSPELMVRLMSSLLTSREHSGQLYSGGITFCGMRPMRSIPFKVICLLGMNHQDFPRQELAYDFDLMSNQHHAGDPGRRIEDRYLMLETLLCARQKLYLSYTGRSMKDNSALQPSVLLQELMDFIDARFQQQDENSQLCHGLTREYPMQAFSGLNFSGEEPGYSRYWCEVANHIASQVDNDLAEWPAEPLSEQTAIESLDIENLRRFIASPVQYFFRQRLGVYLDQQDDAGDDEAFDLDFLQQWQLKQRLAADILEQRDDTEERLLAEGMLAHGQAAAAQIKDIRESQLDWFEALQSFSAQASAAVSVDLRIGERTSLSGLINGYYPGTGLLAYHGGKFKGRQLLMLWIDHLALSAGEHWQAGESSQLLTKDQQWRLPPLPAESAQHLLADYFDLYREGLRAPLPVFPESTFTWASEPDPVKADARVRRNWGNQWAGSAGGDNNDAYIDLVLRNGHKLPFATPRFNQLAHRLYSELLEQRQKL